MSTTNFSVSDPLALKLWARKAFTDSVKETLYCKLIGKTDRAVIQVKDELQKGEGDRTRFSLRSLPKGIGVQNDETLEGKEEGLEFQNFDRTIGEKRHAFKVDLNISQQRTIFDVRQDQTFGNTADLDRLISHVTVTSPRHPLYGQRLEVLQLASDRGPKWVTVRVPNGRRRNILRALTDLAQPLADPVSPPLISAPVLLRVVQYAEALSRCRTEDDADDAQGPDIPDPTTVARPATADPTTAGGRDRPGDSIKAQRSRRR